MFHPTCCVRFVLCFVLLGQINLLPVELSEASLASGLRAEVDRVFAPWDKPESPGCALGIVHEGKLVYQKGYGQANLEQNIPINLRRSSTYPPLPSSSPTPALLCWQSKTNCRWTTISESICPNCRSMTRVSPFV